MAYRDSTNVSGSGTSAVVPAPSGIQNNDILVAHATWGGSSNAALTWPSGFTEFTPNGNVTSPNGITFKAAWKRASSESGSYTITSDTNDFYAATVSAYSGRHLTNAPVAVSTIDETDTASPLFVDATGVTAVAGDDILFGMIQNDGGGQWAHDPPASYTEREEVSPGSWVSLSIADRQNVSAGATGTLTGTLTLSESTGGWGAIVIRIPSVSGSLIADQGSFSTTGQVATLSKGSKLIADQGTYSLTGQVATLTKVGTIQLVAEFGTYSILGSEAFADRDMAAELGTFTVTGQDASLAFGHMLPADFGTYALSGLDAGLLRNPSVTLVAEFGTYALTGYDIFQAFSLAAETGTYAIAGQDDTLRVAHKALADTGAYSVFGLAAALRWSNAPFVPPGRRRRRTRFFGFGLGR